MNLARLDDEPAVGSPGLNSLIWGIEGAAPGCVIGELIAGFRVAVSATGREFCATRGVAGPGVAVAGGTPEGADLGAPFGRTGAILAKFDVPGTAAGAVGAVAGGTNSEVDTGLLLKRTLAAELGAVGVTGAGLDCGDGVAGACGWVAAAVDGPGGGAVLPDPPVTERTTVVTAVTVLVTTDCTADLTTAVVDFVAGASAFAVVTQPAAGFCVLSQSANVVAAWTWQQPQSCDFAPWSGPSAPLVPWLR